jgi:RecA/RadA recombinase
MNSKVAIGRLPTGVPGLDRLLGGGLPEFSFNIIAGTPGSGKTTLARVASKIWKWTSPRTLCSVAHRR